MQSKHKQTKCKHSTRNSYRLQQVSHAKSKNYSKRRYRIRHLFPMFIGTPCMIYLSILMVDYLLPIYLYLQDDSDPLVKSVHDASDQLQQLAAFQVRDSSYLSLFSIFRYIEMDRFHFFIKRSFLFVNDEEKKRKKRNGCFKKRSFFIKKRKSHFLLLERRDFVNENRWFLFLYDR